MENTKRDLEIPESYNYIALFLTMRCNLKCSYCSHGFVKSKYEDMPAREWFKVFSKLDTDVIVLAGKEPTLHKEFIDIVNGCIKSILIYSNLTTDVPVKNIKYPAMWRLSCHSTTEDEAHKFVADYVNLKLLRHDITACTGVKVPEDVNKVLSDANIQVHIDPFMDWPKKSDKQSVKCMFDRVLIAPDGVRYHCLSKMLRKDPEGVLALEAPDEGVVCNSPSACLPCDAAVRVIKS